MSTVKALKIAIESDDDILDFIISNSEYYNFIKCKFIDELDGFDTPFIDFNKVNEIKKSIYFGYEVPSNTYEKYVVGISEQVSKDIKRNIKSERTKFSKKLAYGKVGVAKFNENRCSFKVHARSYWLWKDRKNPKFYSRLRILSDNKVAFRVRDGEWKEFSLKEKLFSSKYMDERGISTYINNKRQCRFSDEDIKEVSFLYSYGKCFIIIIAKVDYLTCNDHTNLMCSLDLGIRNPITLYSNKKPFDSDEVSFVFKMNDRRIARIHYLERRCRKLQSIMDMKRKINKSKLNPDETYVHSKNYEKVRKKFIRTWKKIVNLKMDWRRKHAAKISKSYKVIVVDDFMPPKSTRNKRLNNYNRFYGMSYFKQELINACNKYNSICVDSLKYSTRRCSKCGTINSPLSLSQRVFVCSSCGYTNDRDVNAARNGFNMIYPIYRDIS